MLAYTKHSMFIRQAATSITFRVTFQVHHPEYDRGETV